MTAPHLGITALFALATALATAPAAAQTFTYNPPGALVPGSGEGRVDDTVFVPGMRFPIEVAPAYANSQVWGNGGSQGYGGSQCDDVNYSYPWWDNYCETRDWDMPLCPAGKGHQGQDIRPSTCENNVHWAVAAEAGTITEIGSYSVYLTTADGTIHRYLHMDAASVTVSVSDTVAQGDRLGRVSNNFGGTPTTIHLHYDIGMNLETYGDVWVPPYMSLVRSYEALIGSEGLPVNCVAIPPEGLIIDNKSACFVLHGPSSTWRHVTTAGYDGDLYWSYAWENDASNWAEWIIDFEYDGTYEIEVYITPAYAQSQQTRYTVLHGEDEDELRVDQSSGDGWLSIGTFDFVAGARQNVAVYDGPGEALSLQRQFVADAIRITAIDIPALDPEPDLGPDPAPDPDPEEVGPPDMGPEEPDVGPDQPDVESDPIAPEPVEDVPQIREVTVNDGCGCATSPRSAAGPTALVAGLLLLLGRRRRRSAR